jgi:hypothetical protein
MSLSPALQQVLSQAIAPGIQSVDVSITLSPTLRLPWQ